MNLVGPNGKPLDPMAGLKPWQIECLRHATFHAIDIQKSFNKRMNDCKIPKDDFDAATYKLDKMLTSMFSAVVVLACRYISDHSAVEQKCVELVRLAFAGERQRRQQEEAAQKAQPNGGPRSS